jgi:hypothetical protein
MRGTKLLLPACLLVLLWLLDFALADFVSLAHGIAPFLNARPVDRRSRRQPSTDSVLLLDDAT